MNEVKNINTITLADCEWAIICRKWQTCHKWRSRPSLHPVLSRHQADFAPVCRGWCFLTVAQPARGADAVMAPPGGSPPCRPHSSAPDPPASGAGHPFCSDKGIQKLRLENCQLCFYRLLGWLSLTSAGVTFLNGSSKKVPGKKSAWLPIWQILSLLCVLHMHHFI